MDSPQTFLLKKIVGHSTNGLGSLGKLHAMHIKDIAEVMRLFAVEAITEVAARLNKGESIDLGDGTTLCLERKRQKSKQ